MRKLALHFTPALMNSLFPHGLAPLDEMLDVHATPTATLDQVPADTTVLITGWGATAIDAAALAALPQLQLVAHAAGTVKGVVTPALWRRGIRVISAASANAVPVAEYTVAAILLANKRAFWTNARYHADAQPPRPREYAMSVGNFGKTVGVVGASRVGRLVLHMLQPFALQCLVYDPLMTDADAAALGAERVELNRLLTESDIVSVHAPLLPATVNMIGAAQLARMQSGATLINTARGPIVNAQALNAELVSGRLFAVIDTSDPEPLPADSPLFGLSNVFITPHIAGSLGNEVARMGALAVAEIKRWLADEPLLHEVTQAELERSA